MDFTENFADPISFQSSLQSIVGSETPEPGLPTLNSPSVPLSISSATSSPGTPPCKVSNHLSPIKHLDFDERKFDANTRLATELENHEHSHINTYHRNTSFKDLSILLTQVTDTLINTPSSLIPDIVCRICLCYDEKELCQPCKCTGSSRYIHRECLEKWRKISLNPNSKIQCDVCKAFYKFNSGNFLNGGLSLESAKFMALVGVFSYYTTVIWTFAYLTLMLVSSFRLPPVLNIHYLQNINAYQYWPGLYFLGAYSAYKKNNLFTSLLLISLLSMVGRINVYFGLASHLLWFLFVASGVVNIVRATRFKVDLAAPKLFNLLVEMNSGEEILNVS